jgi:4-hydroxybenzoate polyprenyltransferase
VTIEGGGPTTRPADALPDSIDNSILRAAPKSWRPFIQLARLDRPIGWQLLLLPCWWSSALAGIAAGQAPNVAHLALFMIGAIAMRGAGSTYNDIIDRHIDAGVERTRGRPLPSGRVSVRAAKVFLVAQAVVGALVLFSFNFFTIILGLGSLAIVAIYPFMKRVTSWPQLVLGFAFAYGGLMGWAAAFGSLAIAPALLYASAICWTIGYDTIYALQDARDDAIIGVRSTARLFGGRAREGVSAFYLGAILCATAAVVLSGGGIAAQAGVCAFALHLFRQTRAITLGDPATALRLFRSNRNAGLLLFAGLSLDAIMRSPS